MPKLASAESESGKASSALRTLTGVEDLPNFAGQDLVTEVLRSVTMKTVVFCRAELRAPWGMHVNLPGRAVFHIVLQGQGWLSLNGVPPVHLSPGDTVLFPHADAHSMTDDPATLTRPLEELLSEHPLTADRRFCCGRQGPLTTMLCGAFELDDPKYNLLGVLLPSLLHIKGRDDETSSQLRDWTGFVETELKRSRPGEQAIVTRMAEAFLLRAIRDHVLSASDEAHGLPAMLRDRAIARVLGLIHQHPERSWTVGTLANEANLSRSGFAARFKMKVGAPPQRYLQRHRFCKAADLLRTTDAKISDIADRVGYASESSFSQAFKRMVGKTPGAYRLAK